jgi:hypothetical protein
LQILQIFSKIFSLRQSFCGRAALCIVNKMRCATQQIAARALCADCVLHDRRIARSAEELPPMRREPLRL